MTAHVDVLDLVSRLKASEEPFVLATVVRAVSATAAKAGAKAVIRADGRVEAGWIGGGCSRSAVLKAARAALADGQSRLISVQPEELLSELGVRSGETREGVSFAGNACPSGGTMDIFVEPMLPRPALIVLGSSPIAFALADQARPLGFHITLAAPLDGVVNLPKVDVQIDGFALDRLHLGRRYIVISTQGKGDEAALEAALAADAVYRAFVGSRRKMTALRAKFLSAGFEVAQLDSIKAPAGLDLGAITPEEIALSILAEIVQVHRRKVTPREAGRIAGTHENR